MQREAVSSRIPVSLRVGVIALILVGAALYLTEASRAEEIPPREALSGVPMQFEGWQGRREPDFSADVMAVLGADDYIVRTYTDGGRNMVGLYIGYHASQRQGDTIHSPLNCLPGAGWQPMEQSRATIEVQNAPLSGGGSGPIEINRVIIQKGLDRQLVYYWYQSHRRVVASEYWGKVYTVLDSVRYHRTDAALVRVVAPIPDGASIEQIDMRATRFVQSLFPKLSRHLPS